MLKVALEFEIRAHSETKQLAHKRRHGFRVLADWLQSNPQPQLHVECQALSLYTSCSLDERTASTWYIAAAQAAQFFQASLLVNAKVMYAVFLTTNLICFQNVCHVSELGQPRRRATSPKASNKIAFFSPLFFISNHFRRNHFNKIRDCKTNQQKQYLCDVFR